MLADIQRPVAIQLMRTFRSEDRDRLRREVDLSRASDQGGAAYGRFPRRADRLVWVLDSEAGS